MTSGEFWDQFADRYDDWYEGEAVRRQDAVWLEELQRFASIGQSDRLLDAGCGTGSLLDYVPDDPRYLGLDISPAMVTVAKRKHPEATFMVADLDRRINLGVLFDIVVCNFTFNYLTRPEIAVDNLARALRPGGRLFVVLMQPRRLLRASCPHRFGLRCPVRFHGPGTLIRGGRLRLVRDRRFGMTEKILWPRLEDELLTVVPWAADFRVLVCERILANQS